jgi:preprotein translocase subunit SecE
VVVGEKKMNLIQKPVNFLKEVRAELGKVAWSTRQELMGSTIVVIVITAIMAVYIGIVDMFLGKFLSVVFR